MKSGLGAFRIPLTWPQLFKRTAREMIADDCFGLAAQLAYYFFLALFPAFLFLVALASFFPLHDLIDEVRRALRPIAPEEIIRFLEEQIRQLSNSNSGGLLTIGILGAIWSSSVGVVAIIDCLNRAYDIEEGRRWLKVRLTAILLTLALAAMILLSFSLIVAGSMVAERLATTFALGPFFEWTWKIVQWPLAFMLVSTALGLVYHFGPDAEKEWVWITPGAVVGTTLWVLVSLLFKVYVGNFGNYNATYGAMGTVIVLLLWFYLSGLAILVGAELNAEIERASPPGEEPGENMPGRRRKIGLARPHEHAALRRRSIPRHLPLLRGDGGDLRRARHRRRADPGLRGVLQPVATRSLG